MNFKEKITEWLNLDNEIKLLNINLKELREKRDKIENEITLYSKENNLINSMIKIDDNKLKITNLKINEPITFKYLEKTLSNIINSEEQIKLIMDHIKENRQSKIIQEIKRFTN
jgi:hypothetical protein